MEEAAQRLPGGKPTRFVIRGKHQEPPSAVHSEESPKDESLEHRRKSLVALAELAHEEAADAAKNANPQPPAASEGDGDSEPINGDEVGDEARPCVGAGGLDPGALA